MDSVPAMVPTIACTRENETEGMTVGAATFGPRRIVSISLNSVGRATGRLAGSCRDISVSQSCEQTRQRRAPPQARMRA
jgi:hypothetical protein